MQSTVILSFTLCCACLMIAAAHADPQRKHEHRIMSSSSSEPLHRGSVTVSPVKSPGQQTSIGFGSMFTQFLAPDQKHKQQSAASPATGPSLSSSISSPEGRLLQQMPTSYCAPYGGSICKKYITPTSFVYYNLTTVSRIFFCGEKVHSNFGKPVSLAS